MALRERHGVRLLETKSDDLNMGIRKMGEVVRLEAESDDPDLAIGNRRKRPNRRQNWKRNRALRVAEQAAASRDVEASLAENGDSLLDAMGRVRKAMAGKLIQAEFAGDDDPLLDAMKHLRQAVRERVLAKVEAEDSHSAAREYRADLQRALEGTGARGVKAGGVCIGIPISGTGVCGAYGQGRGHRKAAFVMCIR